MRLQWCHSTHLDVDVNRHAAICMRFSQGVNPIAVFRMIANLMRIMPGLHNAKRHQMQRRQTPTVASAVRDHVKKEA